MTINASPSHNRISVALLGLVRNALAHKRGGFPDHDMTVSITISPDELLGLLAGVGGFSAKLDQILKEQQRMATALDTKIQELKDAVAKETAVDQSILTFIQGVPKLISDAVDAAKAAGATDAQLQSLADLTSTITQNAQTLSDAVTTNTPAAGGTGTGTTDPGTDSGVA